MGHVISGGHKAVQIATSKEPRYSSMQINGENSGTGWRGSQRCNERHTRPTRYGPRRGVSQVGSRRSLELGTEKKESLAM